MALHGLSGQKQVQLTVFENEPEARMSEQILFQEGIRCVIKSLGGGPGLWGTAFNLPHGIYVFEEDAARSGKLLGLDADDMIPGGGPSGAMQFRPYWGWVALVIATVLVLMVAGPNLARLFGG